MKALALSLLLLGFASANAQVCESRFLTLHHPAQSSFKNPVDVRLELEGSHLRASFEVRIDPRDANSPVLKQGQYPFQVDVVELFLNTRGGADGGYPYYEYELTPHGETFEVKIAAPKKMLNNAALGARYKTAWTATGWSAEMLIPLEHLDWDGRASSLVGNAYAILGKKGSRTYWSLSLPSQQKPGFHQPAYFRPLLSCR